MAYNPYNTQLLSSFGSQTNNVYGLPNTVAPLPQTTVAPMVPSPEYGLPVTGNMPNRPIHPEVDVAPLPQVTQGNFSPPMGGIVEYNPTVNMSSIPPQLGAQNPPFGYIPPQPLPPQVFIEPPSSVPINYNPPAPINYNPPAMPHPPPIVQTVGGTPPPFGYIPPQMPNRTIDPEIVARGGATTRKPKPNTRPTPVANTMAPSTPRPVRRPSYSGFYQR